jgi:hypothetical protein
MRDSLMPSRGSGGNKIIFLLLIGGTVAMLIAAVLIYRQRTQAHPKAAPEPADTGAPVKVTRLVTPKPTKPIMLERDTGTGERAEPTPKKKQRKKNHQTEPQGQGNINTDKYNTFINSRFGQVRACYERRLKVNSLLEGKVDINISIDSQGRVNWITVNQDTVRDKEMLECVKKTVRSWQFPEPEGGSVVVGKTFKFKKKGS